MKKTMLLLLTIMIYGFGQSQAQDNLLMNGDFENGRTSWTETAGDISNDGSNSFFYANVEQAGEPSAVNLSQILTIEQGKTYALKFDASTAAGSTRSIWAGIGLNEDPWTSSKQKVNLTDQIQTFTIILTSAAFGSQNSRVLFDMGEEVGFVVLDNVSLEVKENLLINGDFQTGRTSWNDGAGDVIEEGGNGYFFANVESAGNAFDVNLSQILEIEQGQNYLLSFEASTGEGATRKMIAGIGLNEEPWTNSTKTITLTNETQTYTLSLSAAAFGGANSRVLFDMGADVGIIVIDNVSLVVGTAGDGGGGAAPTTGAPIPTHASTDVFAIFSDSYTVLEGTDFNPGWGQATQYSTVDIEGNEAIKLAGLNYQGLALAGNINVSGMTYLHLDFWTVNSTEFKVSLISPGPSENPVALDVPASHWRSVDIALSEYTVPKLTEIFQMKFDGNGDIFIDNIYFHKGQPVSVEDQELSPSNFTLEQNYPNPFNPSTKISFSTKNAAQVTLEVYNVMGQKLATLVNGFVNSGNHTVSFDATNFASGMYLYKLTAGNYSSVKSMMLIK